MLMMLVIMVYQCTKLEFHRPSHSEDMADFLVTVFSGLMTVTFDLLTAELMRNVTRGTDNLPANFDVSVNFCCRVMDKLHQTDDRTS